MPTKDELEAENAELRARVDALQASGAAPARKAIPKQLSSGEVDDLVNAGVTRSPFDGRTLNALDEKIVPGNPEALQRARAERAARGVTD